jgi:galactofuranosylgalactofuranosylrhamnosyl-N-acetylglucosaminyl-diphospho-decaprenol beta-1,5/1,6-galactofuranosyltransferase
MNIIQRIIFPDSSDISGLYFQSEAPLQLSSDGLSIPDGVTVSLNTYFNSFYQQYYSSHTNVGEAQWELRLAGSGTIRLFRAEQGREPRLLSTREFSSAQGDRPVSVAVPAHDVGRVYLEIQGDAGARLEGGGVVSEAAAKDVRLAIAVTCFKKDEYVHRNVRAILDDPLVSEFVDIYLVDNGGSLSGYEDHPNVHIFGNPNTGGAGGFSRGMLEVLDAGNSTHILITDDDIILPPESVFRTINFFRHSEGKVAVSGTMLDSEKPHVMHEAGARWALGTDVTGPSPLKLLPLKSETYLQSGFGLNRLLENEAPDYGAFWFFAFPVELPQQHGLCQPFFVVGDDIDFGLKATRLFKADIVALPSIAVWHVPFYCKLGGLAPYFFHRNLLAVSAVHDDFSSWQVAARAFCEIGKALVAYDYVQACKIIKGVEDFLEGPEMLSRFSLDAIAAGFSSFEEKWRIDCPQVRPPADLVFGLEAKRSLLRSALMLITLGGHLLPRFLLSRAPGAYLTHKVGQWRNGFGHRELYCRHKELGVVHKRTMRRRLGLILARQGVSVTFRLFKSWNRLQGAWKECAARLCSVDSWRARLGLEARQ